MKATGIVRRIDDLGRVVIPKEIRRTMRIREGDPLEIYTSNDGEVIFKKYSAINEMSQNASHVADIMFKLAGCPVVVFDRDHVVAVAGVPKKEFSERRVSPSLEEILENRKNYFKEKRKTTQFLRLKELTDLLWHVFRLFPQAMSQGLLRFLKTELKIQHPSFRQISSRLHPSFSASRWSKAKTIPKRIFSLRYCFYL